MLLSKKTAGISLLFSYRKFLYKKNAAGSQRHGKGAILTNPRLEREFVSELFILLQKGKQDVIWGQHQKKEKKTVLQ